VTFLRRATKEFGLYLWHIDDMVSSLESMSQDAQKSVAVIAELIHGDECVKEDAEIYNSTCHWLREFLTETTEFDRIEMYEFDRGTAWYRIVGQRNEEGCKGYVLDVTQEHAAQLKSRQAEHYLRIISQATFDFVLSVDSKYLVVTAEWGGSEDSDRPQNGDHLADWLHIENDLSCNEMISQAMLSGSSGRDVMFRRGESMAPARCLCIIEPEDPGSMIMAVQIQVKHSQEVGYKNSGKRNNIGLLRAALERRDGALISTQRRTRTLASVSEDLEDMARTVMGPVTSESILNSSSRLGTSPRSLDKPFRQKPKNRNGGSSASSASDVLRSYGKKYASSASSDGTQLLGSDAFHEWRHFRHWRVDAHSRLPTLDSRASAQSSQSAMSTDEA